MLSRVARHAATTNLTAKENAVASFQEEVAMGIILTNAKTGSGILKESKEAKELRRRYIQHRVAADVYHEKWIEQVKEDNKQS